MIGGMTLVYDPQVTEEGLVNPDRATERFNFDTFEKRSVEFGTVNYPLDLYGAKSNYKRFPDIGDDIEKE